MIIPRPHEKGNRMTYKELWNKWLEEKSHYLCSSTVKSRKYCAEAQVLPYIGEIDIRDLSLENLLPVMNAATAETNKVLMQVLRRGVEFGLKDGIMDSLHFTRRPISSISKYMPRKDLEKLISFSRPDWFRDMVILASRTGMRRGELLGLKWIDVDFEHEFLQVHRSLVGDTRSEIELRFPKSGSSRRIRLCDTSLLVLMDRRDKAISEFVFSLPPDGRPVLPDDVSHNMSRACQTANLKYRFHDLRHTHASLLLARGVPIHAVQERLGHADVITTLRTYAHVFPDVQEAAVKILNDL